MPATNSLGFVPFIQVVPHGATDPLLVNPSAIAPVRPYRDPYSNTVGAQIALLTPNSGVIRRT